MSDNCQRMSQIHVVKCQNFGITVETMNAREPLRNWLTRGRGKKPYSEKRCLARFRNRKCSRPIYHPFFSQGEKSWLVAQENSKERAVYKEPVVVLYEVHFLEFAHEIIDARARSAYHLRQRLL